MERACDPGAVRLTLNEETQHVPHLAVHTDVPQDEVFGVLEKW